MQRYQNQFLEQATYPQAEYLQALAAAALQVNARSLVEQGLKGEQIKQGMVNARLQAISAAKANLANAAP